MQTLQSVRHALHDVLHPVRHGGVGQRDAAGGTAGGRERLVGEAGTATDTVGDCARQDGVLHQRAVLTEPRQGQRDGSEQRCLEQEALRAKWDLVDLDRGVLTVPLSKSGRPRHIPLSSAAVRVLQLQAARRVPGTP